jgi:S-adenosylmethionine:tRNA ribosyltransferase-isomerase
MSMPSLKRTLARYDYRFPPELIAQRPASPRDAARLLVVDRKAGGLADAFFRDLPDLLPDGTLLVLNETKVEPARLTLTKEDTGGKVRALIVKREGRRIECLVDRPVRPGQILRVSAKYRFLAHDLKSGRCVMEALFPAKDFPAAMERFGAAPLPPYIKSHGLTRAEARSRYQSVFARQPGSSAAPTASLHFTDRLLKKLAARGIATVKVTLHVSLGTFAPLTEENLREGRLHEEAYEISAAAAKAVNAAKKAGRPVIPVGTTALRALESAADEHGRIKAGRSSTRLFIREGYRFRVADGLVTNFHVPRSSLMILVAALVGRTRLLAAYRHAVAARYRLFSFGDATLILPK